MCAVAYWCDLWHSKKQKNILKFYKCERKKDLVTKDVLRFSSKRIEKYASRVKTPFTLKLLGLSSVLKCYNLSDVNIYLNKIDMSF